MRCVQIEEAGGVEVRGWLGLSRVGGVEVSDWVSRKEGLWRVNIFPLLAYFLCSHSIRPTLIYNIFAHVVQYTLREYAQRLTPMSAKPISRERKYKNAYHNHWQPCTPETGRQCWGKPSPSEVQECWNCTVAHITRLSFLFWCCWVFGMNLWTAWGAIFA